MNNLRGGFIRYVMLFEARSGSTYLTEALDAHPNIYAMGEKYAERKSKGREQLEAMRDFFDQPPDGDFAAIGFKTKLKDVARTDLFADLLIESKCRVILLSRRNIIKHVVSLFNAQRLYDATGNWNLYRPDERLTAFTISPSEFDRWLQKIEIARNFLNKFVSKLQLPTLCLYYEDLLLEQQTYLELALSFLGVRPEAVQGASLKNTSDNLRDVLSNFDELKAQYAGTHYASMFDEILKPTLKEVDNS